jgi:predicted transcriptional regulator
MQVLIQGNKVKPKLNPKQERLVELVRGKPLEATVEALAKEIGETRNITRNMLYRLVKGGVLMMRKTMVRKEGLGKTHLASVNAYTIKVGSAVALEKSDACL